jgi:hypothetical protein
MSGGAGGAKYPLEKKLIKTASGKKMRKQNFTFPVFLNRKIAPF